MANTVNFGSNPTQDIIDNTVNSISQEQPKTYTQDLFIEWVNKMRDTEGISDVQALTRSLELFKNSWYEIDWIDIDSQLTKYQPQVQQETEEKEDTWFFEAIWDVLQKRWDKWAEILTAWVKGSQGQWKLESWVQYAANLLWGLAEVTGTAFIEWLDALTPEVIQEKVKEWIQAAAETQWGQFVVDKLTKVNENMELLREYNPRVARNFEAFGNSIDAALTFYGWKTAAEWAKAWAKAWVKAWVKVPDFIKTWAEVTWDALKKGAKAVAEVPWDAAKSVFRQAYKLNEDTINQAFKNPELFTKAQKQGSTEFIRETTDKVVEAVQTRMKDLSELWKEYKAVRQGAKVFDSDSLLSIMNKQVDSIPSKQLTKSDKTAIETAKSYIKGYEWDLTDIDLLSLRKQLDSIKYDPTTWLEKKLSPQGNKIVSWLRADIDKVAKEKIKGLKELDMKFADEIKEVKEIQKVIFTNNWELKQNYIWEIAWLLWDRKIRKLDTIKKVVPDIENKINMYKALKDLDMASEWFKVWTYSASQWDLITAWVWAMMWGAAWALVWAVIYRAITNPKLWIEIVKKLSLANNVKNSIVKKMKEWVKLSENEALKLWAAIKEQIREKWAWIADDLADKVWARSKFMDDTGDFRKVEKIDDMSDKDFMKWITENPEYLPFLEKKVWKTSQDNAILDRVYSIREKEKGLSKVKLDKDVIEFWNNIDELVKNSDSFDEFMEKLGWGGVDFNVYNKFLKNKGVNTQNVLEQQKFFNDIYKQANQ